MTESVNKYVYLLILFLGCIHTSDSKSRETILWKKNMYVGENDILRPAFSNGRLFYTYVNVKRMLYIPVAGFPVFCLLDLLWFSLRGIGLIGEFTWMEAVVLKMSSNLFVLIADVVPLARHQADWAATFLLGADKLFAGVDRWTN